METQPNNWQHCVFDFLRNCDHHKKTGVSRVTVFHQWHFAGRVEAMIRSSCNLASVSGCKCRKNNLAGHTIDPDLLLDDGVLSIDHHAAGQKTIFVSTVASLTSVNIPGDFVNLHVHINRRSNSNSPAVAAVAASSVVFKEITNSVTVR